MTRTPTSADRPTLSDGSRGTVLVTGATGRQGGAVARALLAAGTPVRALVRDATSDRAAALASAGASLVVGDLDDPASLLAAATGAAGVFSVQTPDMTDLFGESETRQAAHLLTAARTAGVTHLVHTSVAKVGGWREVPGLADGRYGAYMAHYWASKSAVEDAVRGAGLPRWTILRPATFMEMFVRPSFYFVGGTSDRFLTAVRADTPLPLVAVRDIGTAAAAAFADPERFDGVQLELAGDVRSLREVAAAMSEALGATIEPPTTTPEQAVAAGLMPELAQAQQLTNDDPGTARPELAHALGIPTTTLQQWCEAVLRPGA